MVWIETWDQFVVVTIVVVILTPFTWWLFQPPRRPTTPPHQVEHGRPLWRIDAAITVELTPDGDSGLITIRQGEQAVMLPAELAAPLMTVLAAARVWNALPPIEEEPLP